MLLERPLSLKQIFHYYTQINQQRDRIIRMQQLTYNFFSFFSLFCGWFVLFFFSFYFFQFQHFFLFFFFCSFRVGRFLFLPFFFLLVCSCFFFLLLSIPASFFVLFVAVVLWCLKLQFTVTMFILSPWRTRLAQAPNWTMLYSHLQRHNHKDAGRKTHYKDAGRTSLEKYSPLTLLQGFEKVV